MAANRGKLRFGIIGCGHVVQTVHMPAWGPINRVQLAAICDPSSSALDAVGARFQKARRYSDVDAFLADATDLDFVVVATPGDSHAAICEKVLRSRLHVLCEKPLALNEQDLRNVYDTADQEGLVLTAIQNYKFRDTVIKALEYKESGAIGNVTDFTVRLRGGSLLDETAIWRREERKHRVLLFDFGIHYVHLALLFGGPISKLRFVDAQVNNEGLEYVVFGTLHENGCRGLFELILNSQSTGTDLEVLGETGGFALDFFPHGFRVLPRRDTPLHRGIGDARRLIKFGFSRAREYLPGGIPDRAIPHHQLFLAFIQAISENAPNPVPPAEVIESISLLAKVAEQAYAVADFPSKGPGTSP